MVRASTTRIAAASAALALALAATPVVAQDEAVPDHLARIVEAGVIRMSTDGLYPPQSELTPDGNYQGFDIDVGTEIATRLGVGIEFTEPGWEVITAGSWGDRWDMSVGSMTITSAQAGGPRLHAALLLHAGAVGRSCRTSAILRVDGLAGKTVCIGAATTYLDWMDGTLDFGTESPDDCRRPRARSRSPARPTATAPRNGAPDVVTSRAG